MSLRRRLVALALTASLASAFALSTLSGAQEQPKTSNIQWGKVGALPNLTAVAKSAGLSTEVDGEQCFSSTSCTAYGHVSAQTSSSQMPTVSTPFVDQMAGGRWGVPQELPGLSTFDEGLSATVALDCANAKNCLAYGNYGDVALSSSYVDTESKGIWGTPERVPGLASLQFDNSSNVTFSCPSAGNCTGGGYYWPKAGVPTAYLVVQRSGTWGSAFVPKGLESFGSGNSDIDLVKCAAPGDCIATGVYQGTVETIPLVIEERSGVWSPVRTIPWVNGHSGGHIGQITSISCPRAGSCVIAGFAFVTSARYQYFVQRESNWTWGRPQFVPGLYKTISRSNYPDAAVSCPAVSECTIAGNFDHGPHELLVFASTMRGGTLSKVHLLTDPVTHSAAAPAYDTIMGLACTAIGHCGLVMTSQSTSPTGPSWAVVGVADFVKGKWLATTLLPGTSSPRESSFTATSMGCETDGGCYVTGSYWVGATTVAFVTN